MKDIVRWWFAAAADIQFLSIVAATGAFLSLLCWSAAIVAMLCGWQPWAH